MKKPLVLATRQSTLALRQAEIVALALRRFGEEIKILPLTTTGDEIQNRPLTEIGGKELFIHTLQEAVLDGRADFAVHSLKDMAAQETTSGLCLAAVGFGEAANDVLLGSRKLQELPPNSVIGTCSPRRSALLRHYAPQLTVKALRGNVQTRLAKLASGEFDAIILAAAGLNRLQLASHISEHLNIQRFIPAVGQGLLAVECLSDNQAVVACMKKINNPKEMNRAIAERAFAAAIGGDCNTPLGGHATVHDDDTVTLNAFYETPAGEFLSASNTTPVIATEAGLRVADDILRRL